MTTITVVILIQRYFISIQFQLNTHSIIKQFYPQKKMVNQSLSKIYSKPQPTNQRESKKDFAW